MIKTGTSLEDAKRELREAWRDCRPSCASADQLFHYTSAEGLHGILKHKKLRLSNVSTFNDTSEMRYGWAVIKEALASQPGARGSTLNLKAAAEKGGPFVKRLVPCSYAFCFCAEHDCLCQWRAYGGGGAGFEIGFNRATLEAYLEGYSSAKSVRVTDPGPMVYNKEWVKGAVNCFVSKAIAIAEDPRYGVRRDDLDSFRREFEFLVVQYLLAMKNPSFSEEKEWRILHVSLDQKDVNFRPARGIIVPYLELSAVPPEVFAGVTLGPKIDPEFAPKLMRLFLNRNQLEHVEVRPSKIPLRMLP